jgi:hypothetical protein
MAGINDTINNLITDVVVIGDKLSRVLLLLAIN